MIEERKLKIYPHEHLLGTEGLLPNEINFLLDLSKSFENHLKNDKKKKFDYLKNKICINLFFENSTRTELHLGWKKLNADILISCWCKFNKR